MVWPLVTLAVQERTESKRHRLKFIAYIIIIGKRARQMQTHVRIMRFPKTNIIGFV